MIVKPTVFVLGAGASQPYGFPTGAGLANRICRELHATRPDGSFRNAELSTAILGTFTRHAITPELIQAFEPAFQQSGCTSLDEFVEAKGNHRFLDLVKAAIILTLIGYEDDRRLFPDKPDRSKGTPDVDWCRYLFRYMKTNDETTFEKNQVKVITFNFDRSFERQLFRMIQSAYGMPEDVAATMRRSISVLHLHGSLGDERWIGESGPDARDYVPDAPVEQRVALLDNIRIIHEEIKQETLDKAHDWLREADMICFLGFGFHPINMKRLRLNELYNGKIWGTAFGLSEPELMRVRKFFNSPVHFDESATAYRLLRHSPVLQTDYD